MKLKPYFLSLYYIFCLYILKKDVCVENMEILATKKHKFINLFDCDPPYLLF